LAAGHAGKQNSLTGMANFFPRWTNWLPLKIAVCGIAIVCGLTAGTWYYITPKYTRVGYEPIQPVPFPHDIHVTQLGMDCRYCHSFVDVAAHSNLPSTQTCMACHTQVQKENPKLVFLDVMMPKMNGMEVCRRVKKELLLDKVFIVLLTAKGQELDRQKGQEVGADLYMTKPFDPEVILLKARQVLDLNNVSAD